MSNEKETDMQWLWKKFNVDTPVIVEALKRSPSAQGYIQGAVSELLLVEYLQEKGYEVKRIKEKPAGGFDEKKQGYKGDFLINKKGSREYYVVECKGLKTNSEFRTGETDEGEHIKKLTKKQAYNLLKKYINPDKEKIYKTGLKKYNKAKDKWEEKNPGKVFPEFRWSHKFPGPDSVDLSDYFTLKELKEFIDEADEELLSENAFRNGTGLYKILQTHQPSNRKDPETEIISAAPLVKDFSIMVVDLYQRTGVHQFVFMNPDEISHSPSSPNHLYQNYIIDVIIPGKKDELVISRPWYTEIETCISETNPRKVEYDVTQIDYR